MANFAQADLRFLLPLHKGQQVVVLGDAPQLVEALLAEEIRIERGSYQSAQDVPLPFAAASVDHVMMPVPPDLALSWWFDEAARILKPGGSLLVGIHNAGRLQRLRFWKRSQSSVVSLTLSNCQHLLNQSGFSVSNRYGVHDDLQRPQHLVPLERAEITRYFFDHVIASSSIAGQLTHYAAALLAALHLQHVLYTDIAVVAYREH